MNRYVCLFLALVVLPISNCCAAIPTRHYVITAGKKQGTFSFLAAEGGRLVLGSRSRVTVFRDKDGRRDITDSKDGWFVMGTKIKSSVGGLYLAYDPAGKDNSVHLAKQGEGEGTEWFIRQGRPYKDAQQDSEEWGTLQAASGPMKGWYLDVDEVEEKQEDGKTLTVRRFILSKSPSWNVEVARVYIHL